MVQQVINIGNSRGIRLPQAILKHCGIGDHVEIEIRGEELVMKRLPAVSSESDFYSISAQDDLTIQLMLRDMDMGTLAAALVGAPAEIRTRLEANMSDRAREVLAKDIERMEAADAKEMLIEMNRSRVSDVLQRLG